MGFVFSGAPTAFFKATFAVVKSCNTRGPDAPNVATAIYRSGTGEGLDKLLPLTFSLANLIVDPQRMLKSR